MLKWFFQTRKRGFLTVYLVLLAASHIFQLAVSGYREPGDPSFRVVTLDDQVNGPVKMAVKELPADDPDAPTIMLLHGTPMASATFDRLLPHLEGHAHLIVPDLVGFGYSSQHLEDYSFRSHAMQLGAFIEQEGMTGVHVVAYSQAGGIAPYLARSNSAQIDSVTLLSAIGVQEYELFGDYYLNHVLYGVQLAGIWCLQHLLPHFGSLDDRLLNLPYARNFFDSDQRPLRRLLEGVDQPVLVLHGKADTLVLSEAAEEHARIVPQSELALLEGGHLLVFKQAEEVARRILDFAARVEDGRAPARADAEPERIEAAAQAFDWSRVPPARGATLILIMLSIVIGTLITEDLTCVITGFLIARGTITMEAGLTAAILGIFFGDIILYFAGRALGQSALKKMPFKLFIKETSLLRSEEWFERRGPIVILLSRFVPGTRLPTYFVAGLLKTPMLKFTLYFLLAVILWTPALIGLSVVFGEKMLGYLETYTEYGVWGVVLAALVVLLVVEVGIPALSIRGRRLLMGKWQRLLHWEFWPPWAIYPFVLLYVLCLGVRHRSLSLFTCANPGIPGGGFIGESKFDIMENLSGAGDVIARTFLIEKNPQKDLRQARILSLVDRHGLTFPLVMKPDRGERGTGVHILRAPEDIVPVLNQEPEDLLLQEYVPGQEYGVFYVRKPGQDRGFIFSLTEKQLPEVVGDGKHMIQDLILRDRRARCMAAVYLAYMGQRIYEVPPRGERIRLVELGTHCRGAVFLDGMRLVTPELEEEIDRISKAFDGFYFGRYDIRVPSEEDFSRGRNFKVLELNGVSSEATSIYDPKNGYWQAQRILFEQWRLAFEVAQLNREAGCRPMGAWRFLVFLYKTLGERRR